MTFLLFISLCFAAILILQHNSKANTMGFVMKDVYIGQMIQDELIRQGRTVNWFAKGICCEKSNVYKLFKRKSLDLAQLMKVCELLNHNFLKDCYEES